MFSTPPQNHLSPTSRIRCRHKEAVMNRPNPSHRILVGTRSWARLLIIILLVGCGNKDSDAHSAAAP